MGRFLAVFSIVIALAGCATRIVPPAEPPQPSTVRFGHFERLQMVPVQLDSNVSRSARNQRAQSKISENLLGGMRLFFPSLEGVPSGADFPKTEERILRITPSIQKIVFTGPARRFWAKERAGKSAILMKVVFRDGATGEVVANPVFYRQANDMEGWSPEITYDGMLDNIARDIVAYTAANR